MKLSFKPSLRWLFAFIPVTVALEHVEGLSPPLLFFSAALAIVPIAALIVRSTEHLSEKTGDTVGGLLNATFGNAPELIISIVALRAGLHDMVRASLVGALLANLLLAQGASFLLGGLRHHEQKFNARSSKLYASMMLIAVISLIVPSAFSRFLSAAGPDAHGLAVSFDFVLCGVLLAAYALYLFFMMKTHADLFRSEAGAEGKTEGERGKAGKGRKEAAGGHGDPDHGPPWSLTRSIASLLVASVLAAWMSEILVGAAEGTGKSLGMSEVFIGIVFLAIVGGAAESGSAIAMARKDKMDLSVGIALGSCVQIALFVAPLLVFISHVVSPSSPLTLSFTRAETGTLFLAVLLSTMVASDGTSNWYKGVQLVVMYGIVALLFYFLPT
jgi:Ca2+:H+ antiporter